MNEQMLITIEPRIAQPREVIVSPVLVKPSIVKVSGLSCWLIQATNRRSDPLITNEIRPKVSIRRYATTYIEVKRAIITAVT